MKIHPAIILVSFLFFAGFSGCDKYSNVTGEVELYLLQEYETVDGSPEIDLNSIVLANDPLIGYSDFRSYNAKEHYFKLTDDAREAVEKESWTVGGTVFAVTADEEVIYTGYFVPIYSSLSVQWIVIDPLFSRLNNNMYVELGYPGQLEGTVIPDHRNDPRILDIFHRDGKLIK